MNLKNLLGLICLFMVCRNVIAANKTASVSGNWNNTTTWGGSSIPGAGDNVTISSGIVVTCTASATCDNLTANNNAGAITVNSGVTLTIRGLLNCATSGPGLDIIGGTGTVLFTGAALSSPFLVLGANWSASQIFNNVTFDPGSAVTLTTSTGNLKADATILINSGTLTMGSSTEIRGTDGNPAVLTIASGATLNISGQIRGSSSAASFCSTVNINGTLNSSSYVNAITLNIGSTGVFNTSYAGTQGWWNTTNAPTTVNLNTSSTINYNLAGAQVIANGTSPSILYGNLILSGSGAKSYINTNLNIANNLDIQGTVTFPSLAASTINVGGNWTTYNHSAFSAGTTTVVANGSAAQTFKSTASNDFEGYNVLVVNSGSILELGSNIQISSACNINGTLDAAGYVVNKKTGSTPTCLFGSEASLLTQNGTGVDGTLALTTSPIFNTNNNFTFYGAVAQTTGSLIPASINNLTISGTNTVTLIAAIIINNSLSISSGTLDCSNNQITGNATGLFTMNAGTSLLLGSTTSSITVSFPTNFITGNITLSPSSTVSYQVGGTQIISGIPTYGNLTITGSGIKLLAASIMVNGNLSVLAGTLACITNQITGNTSGSLNMSSGTTLLLGSTGSATAVLFPANFTTSHSNLNSASTVNYQVGGAQTISNIPQYGNLIVSGSGTKTLAGAVTVKGNTSISSGTLDCSTFQFIGTSGKSFTMSAGTNLLLGSTASATVVSFPTNYLVGQISLDDASTVTYQSNASQTISATPATYGNLVLSSGSASTTKTTAGILSIDGILTINTNTTLDVTLANNYGIFLNGNWVNNGTFNAQAGTVTLSGVSGQSIGGTSVTTFYNLTSNNAAGISLSSAQNLSGTLLLNAGIFNTNSQVFTLVTMLNGSNYTTGNIGIIDPSADISGDVTLQQYAARSGYTGWALLGNPITSPLTFADWNDNFSITCANCPNGCCPGGQAFTSIDYYDETQPGAYGDASKYVAIQNITDAIMPAKGYWVYLGNGSTNAIMFDVSGTVAKAQTTPVTLPITYTDHGSPIDDGWNLISNPLPSPISWTALLGSTANIDNAIYVYNQGLNSGMGAYAQYVAGVSSPVVSSGGLGDTIAMCQAFYVHSTGATALTALETNKINANPGFLRMNTHSSVDTYKRVVRMFLDNGKQHDEAAFYFDPAATIHFEKTFDAYKVLNDPTQPYIASISDGFMCSISGLPASQNISVPLKAICSTTGAFTISLGGNASTGICINLFDSYTGTTTNLLTTSYTCTLYDTTTTARFTISFGTSPLSAVTKITQPVCVAPKGLITAIGNSAGPWNYTWRDNNGNVIKTSPNKTSADSIIPPFNGDTYIVEINTNGTCDYFTQSIAINPIIIPVAQFALSSDTLYLPNAIENFINTSTNTSVCWWDFGNGNSSSSANNNLSYIYQNAGIFKVSMVATSSTTCTDTTTHIVYVINTTTGINSVQNPSLNLLNNGMDNYSLSFNLLNASNVSIDLYNINGQSVYTYQLQNIKSTSVNFNLMDLPIGLYLLKVGMPEQGIKVFKLLKQ